MRPYLILMVVVLTTVVLTAAAFGQRPVPRPYGASFYGCGPYIPFLTTPEISLETVSLNPVGGSNATTGLIAGATNSTLSQIEGSTSSVYTEAVWYRGGAPLITPQVHLWPEPIGREGRPMREARYEERSGEEVRGGVHPREDRLGSGRPTEERGQPAEARGDWIYFTAPTKAARVYSNDDVTRQNDKNGAVKYDGKTEKM